MEKFYEIVNVVGNLVELRIKKDNNHELLTKFFNECCFVPSDKKTYIQLNKYEVF